MSQISEDGRSAWILGSALLVPFLLFGLGILTIVPFTAASLFILYFCLLVINFEAGFLGLIFIRSSVDYLKNVGGGTGAVNLAAAISLALIVLGIFYVLYSKANIFKFEETGPFLVFLALCGLSIFYSPDMKEAVSDWLRLVSIFSVYILTRIIFVSKEKIRQLFVVILLSAFVPILTAYFQLVTGHGTVLDGGQYRIVGTFLHPNAFASYLLILLIFCTAQMLEGAYLAPKRLMAVFTAAAFVIFIFTFSRGAWIAFILAMVLIGFLRYRKILGFLPVILTLSVLMVPAIKDRILNIFDAGYTHGRSGWEWRLDTWSEVSGMLAKKPIFGHGLASVQTEFGILTHNDYLRILAEVGTLGLLAYLYLSYSLLRRTWQDFQSARSNITKCFQAGLLAVISGFLVREFADNSLRNTVMMIYFWIFVAIARNIARLESRTSPQA